ncbi:MAG: alanine--tRNA ligase, partial [Aeriscardovia sp.]|nr:alanine--tRNA ligase [Aeriscardovia sp.]
MKTSEIADRFLNYFEKRGHLVKPSASLVSSNPTTLFTIAGMIPFIPYLLGEQKPESKRMASLQKCVRTLDIDEVGRTTRHGTFFQMLGNFSFGDYFKKEAIGWAWDLLTGSPEEGGYGLDPARLFVTVFKDDSESEEIWRSLGVAEDHIQKLGMEDNFWTTGGPGPGGPCSEIFLDQGAQFGQASGPAGNDRRYIEIWDLVFENYEVDNVQSKTNLHIAGELKNKNIDTGMGLERLSYLLNGKKNIYETDEIFPVIEATEILSGTKYGSDPFSDTHMRIVADHVRSAMMIMADGVKPSNLARGYVLRRLLRRSVRSLTLLGAPERALLPELLEVSEKAMKEEYPELEGKISSIQAEAEKEEETFRRTLDRGSDMLSCAISRAKAEKKEKIDGRDAFQLHDTFGFPIELTREIARESGLEVDEEGFKAQMAIQKARARQDAVNKRHNVDVSVYDEAKKRLKGEQEFTGYETLSSSGTILEILSEKGPVQKASKGEMADLVLDSSSFYFERGGQLADRGEIVSPTGVCEVLDVQQPVKGLTVHHCRVEEGEVLSGQKVQTLVDSERRAGLARSHTATHILHRAIREVMGPDAVQSGSVVDVDALSFDYKSGRAPTKEELFAIEQMVNMKIMEDLPVSAEEM